MPPNLLFSYQNTHLVLIWSVVFSFGLIIKFIMQQASPAPHLFTFKEGSKAENDIECTTRASQIFQSQTQLPIFTLRTCSVTGAGVE